MTLSPTRFTGILASNNGFGRGRTLLPSLFEEAIRLTARSANATEGEDDRRGYGVYRDFIKRVNHFSKPDGLLIYAEPDRHKPSGRYAPKNAVPK